MQKRNLQIIFVLGLLTALTFYIYQDLSNKNNDLNISGSDQIDGLVEGIEVIENEEEGLIIEEIIDENIESEQKEFVPIPNLDRKIEFPTGFSENVQKIITDRINSVIKELENNPDSYDDWISLGLQRKMIEDYIGVELAWEYAKYLEPDKFLAWSNLGDLYAYYLKDNVKAEENYIGAIERGSTQVFIYFKIAEFYTDFLNNKEKAIEFVKIGLKYSPNSEDLKNLLESLK